MKFFFDRCVPIRVALRIRQEIHESLARNPGKRPAQQAQIFEIGAGKALKVHPLD
jgi:predicted nuclease of predicted toxin-antitoxin system